jgi:hydrogenase maturation protease
VHRFLVLCLGNEILSDDAVGPVIARRLQAIELGNDDVEVIFTPTAGFSLLDLLENRAEALIVDSIITGTDTPGTIRLFVMGEQVPTHNLINSHEINLPTALSLGRAMGYQMPKNVSVLTIEARDVTTLSERLTPPVSASVDEAVAHVLRWIQQINGDIAIERELQPAADCG